MTGVSVLYAEDSAGERKGKGKSVIVVGWNGRKGSLRGRHKHICKIYLSPSL